MNKEFIKQKLSDVPILPGCYIWKDEDDVILYIGKAVNLRARMNSYFTNYDRLDPKIHSMVDQIRNFEFFTVDSEVEALILETNLIKKYKPKYNRLMKDDKNYIYLKIDWYKPYPSVKVVREKDDKKAEYYGPYPDKFPVTKVLQSLRRVYPYCNHLPKGIKSILKKPCFDTHIGLCSGVCSGLISKSEHRRNIKGIRDFFKGKKVYMIEKLKKDMDVLSKDLQFEKAAELRDKTKALEYVVQHIKVDDAMDDIKLQLMKKELKERALEDLLGRIGYSVKVQRWNSEPTSDLVQQGSNQEVGTNKRNSEPTSYKLEPAKSFRMECYDISNIQGTNPTGSMVVFIDGKSEKSLYRKFKIKSKQTPDDFGMMKEVLERRLKYLTDESLVKVQTSNKGSIYKIEPTEEGGVLNEQDESFNQFPDLIIVDGGKGQLSSVYQILKQYRLLDKICLIGLAKREEEIFKIVNEDNKGNLEFKLIKLQRKSEALYLIQRIRDEAHRFAIGFHRKLRSKGQTKSLLDDIPGVGKVTKEKLIKAFGTVDRIKKVSFEDLNSVVRNKRTAEKIQKVLSI